MQCILGIDLSSQPCELTVSEVDGNRVDVTHRATVALPIFASLNTLKSSLLTDSLIGSKAGKAVGADDAIAGDGFNGSGDNEPLAEVQEKLEISISELKRCISELPQTWTATSVILPQNDFLALNLDLPFADPRNLDRIIDLEVQDVVPFELEPFFVQYSPLGVSSGDAAGTKGSNPPQHFDIHVGLLPRTLVRNVLEICKQAGLEPNVLTVPSSAIGAVYQLAREFLGVTNSAVVYSRGDEYCIAIYINGEVRVERTVYASQIIPASSPEKRREDMQFIFTALKLILASTERRYGEKIEKVYLLGRQVKGSNAHQLFGKPLEGLPIGEILKSDDGQLGISALSAVFAQDDALASPLSNFRSREFSFTPRIAEFIRALIGTKKSIIRAAISVAIAIAIVYGSRGYLISSYENDLIARIRDVIPNFPDEPQRVKENMMNAVNKLADELGAFGSRSKVTPADAFIEVVKSIPNNGDIAVTSIRVSGIKIQISGNAAELSPVEKFVKLLDSRKEIFSKIEYSPTRIGNRFNVSVTITLAS
jgi:hypothetical protein